MATCNNGLAATLYLANVTEALVGDSVKVTLTEDTKYPFESDILFTLNTQQEVSFPLYLRIPAWAEGSRVSINGEDVDSTPVV